MCVSRTRTCGRPLALRVHRVAHLVLRSAPVGATHTPWYCGYLAFNRYGSRRNVIIFERVKDEYKHSTKPISTCIKAGFKRSAGAIIDGQVTTLIGAIVLWVLGSASIVGFAVTLFIGIILSLFCSLVVTRLVLKAFMPLNSTSEKFYGLKRVKEDENKDSVPAQLAKEEA